MQFVVFENDTGGFVPFGDDQQAVLPPDEVAFLVNVLPCRLPFLSLDFLLLPTDPIEL